MIFENSEFGTVRALEIDREPWFVGRDVAVILGYKEPAKAVRERVDVDDKGGVHFRHPWRKARD